MHLGRGVYPSKHLGMGCASHYLYTWVGGVVYSGMNSGRVVWMVDVDSLCGQGVVWTEGVCGQGCVWIGCCEQGVCTPLATSPVTAKRATEAGDTYPTGMHSCLIDCLLWSSQGSISHFAEHRTRNKSTNCQYSSLYFQRLHLPSWLTTGFDDRDSSSSYLLHDKNSSRKYIQIKENKI